MLKRQLVEYASVEKAPSDSQSFGIRKSGSLPKTTLEDQVD